MSSVVGLNRTRIGLLGSRWLTCNKVFMDNRPATLLVALAILFLAIIVIRQARRRSRFPSGTLPYLARGPLLCKGELAFFHALRDALPPYLFFAVKVRVPDMLKCDAAAWKQGFGGRISQKHVDFVIADVATSEVVLVVELDDKSHRQFGRADRDQFLDRAFAAAGIRVAHVPAAARYDARQVAAMLKL
jgi:hypothetical protein